jgi:hypothetical protein
MEAGPGSSSLYKEKYNKLTANGSRFSFVFAPDGYNTDC